MIFRIRTITKTLYEHKSQIVAPLKKAVQTYVLRTGIFLLALFFSFIHNEGIAQPSGNISWTTERLGNGIYWKSYKGDALFDSKQNINLVEVFLDSITADFKLAHLVNNTQKTSEFAEQHDAVVAINGSFFREDTGGSLGFLKVNGNIIFEGRPGRSRYQEDGAVAWSDKRKLTILRKSQKGWKNADFENVLSSGPMLVFKSKVQTFRDDPFHNNRHPRTAVGITNDRRLYLVTIDGRSFQAYGMTMPELAQFFKVELGAEHALNLDGGGSTSMWIKHTTENGIVNYPSDNLEFDHKGERNVANAFLIVPSDKEF